MQGAIALLQGDNREDYREGVQIGRELFATLPENNPIVKREKERWSLENQRDACFADMYLHPVEVDYNIETLFSLIEASGLEFVGFSNPRYWDLARLLANSATLSKRGENLSDRQRYRLIELLDPNISHYEFFLARPPLVKLDWSNDQDLTSALVELNPCLDGWPSQHLFNYDYEYVQLTDAEYQFMTKCTASSLSVGEILTEVPQLNLDGVRSLQARQIIVLNPKTTEKF
jgi:hypothetical protein